MHGRKMSRDEMEYAISIMNIVKMVKKDGGIDDDDEYSPRCGCGWNTVWNKCWMETRIIRIPNLINKNDDMHMKA